MKKNKYIIGTILSAISLAIILGIFVSGMFRGSMITISRFILIPVFSIIFIYWGYKTPKPLELITYAVALILLTQAAWDWYAHDWNLLRLEIAIPCIISLIINTISGKVRLSGMEKTFKGQFGLK